MARLAGENSCSSGAVNGGYGRGCEQQHQEDGWTTLTSEKRLSAQAKLRNRRRNLFTLRRDGERTNEVDFRLQQEKFHGETRTSQGPGNQKWIWFLWAFMLMRMEPAGATTPGNNCGRESTDICFKSNPYIQTGVLQGSSVVLADLPGPDFQVEMVIFSEGNQALNCDQYSADYAAGCRMSLFGGHMKDSCGSLYPSILLHSNENGSQALIATNVTGRLQYCMKISSQNHYWIHQGGIFIQPAVTCTLDSVMKPFLPGCIPDASGGIKVGSICSFPSDDGGDVKKTCLLSGMWSDSSSCTKTSHDGFKVPFIVVCLVAIGCFIGYVIIIFFKMKWKKEQGPRGTIAQHVNSVNTSDTRRTGGHEGEPLKPRDVPV